MPFPILFENGGLLAVDKPVGIATIFERRRETGCLIQALREETGLPLMVVHRLDKDVSGVVVFAKNPAAHRTLNLQFDRREVHKTYIALVHGKPEPARGEIRKPIRQFGSGRMGVDERKGQDSLTRYVVERSNERFAWMRLQPVTGRRHQLRVHLYSIGHPIAGDPLYGEKDRQKEFPRLMLHAHRIEFGWEGAEIAIESPIPDAFERCFSSNERNSR